MINFRLWLENNKHMLPITPTLRLRLDPQEAMSIYEWLVDWPRGGDDPVRIRMTDWIFNNFRPRLREEDVIYPNGQQGRRVLDYGRRNRVLLVPINLDTLPYLDHIIEDLKYWHTENRHFGYDEDDIGGLAFLDRVLNEIQPPYIKLMKLKAIAEKAEPKWKVALLEAIKNNDVNAWLVYADNIEERGDRKYSSAIRRLFSS